MNIFKKPSPKATKRFLATLLCGSLILGTLGVNAVSISFDDLEQVEEVSEETETNISFEELETKTSETEELETVSGNEINTSEDELVSYIDEYYFPETTEENIQTFSLDDNSIMALNDSETIHGYFTSATNITVSNCDNQWDDTHSQWLNSHCVVYKNTSPSSDKYVLYENCVQTNSPDGKTYDLVIQPFRVTANGIITTSNTKEPNTPILFTAKGRKNGFKIIITEHRNINKPVKMKVRFGFSDLKIAACNHVGADGYEYLEVPATFVETHKGTGVEKQNITENNESYYKYTGKGHSSTDQQCFDTACVIGDIEISENGMIIYWGSTGNTCPYTIPDGGSHCCPKASLSFSGIADYWEDIGEPVVPKSTYTIQFNANGGSGSVPSTITKEGTDTSVVMGNINNVVPTKTNYTFKGWSASPTGTSRIAYSGVSGATTTSSSWTYANYCSNTGGDSSNKTLTLYAVWEYAPQYSHTLSYNANGGTNAPSSSTVTNTSSTYSMTVSSSQPTRTGYTFAGWNTNSSGNGTNYSAGNSVSVGANSTVTLYAKWNPITYSITYNGNGNTEGSTASQTKTYNVAINLQNNGFTKTGYHFTGWNTASNGTGTSYSAGASYSSNANLALYAQWAINSSTLKINPNGGTWNNSTATQSFTQNYNTTKAIPVPTRTGYTFTKWNRSGTNGSMTSLTGSSTYTFGSSNGVTDTLTAEWKINNYTVTYIDVIDLVSFAYPVSLLRG